MDRNDSDAEASEDCVGLVAEEDPDNVDIDRGGSGGGARRGFEGFTGGVGVCDCCSSSTRASKSAGAEETDALSGAETGPLLKSRERL